MKDEKQSYTISEKEYEFLILYIKETWQEMRHVEQLRATVSSLVIALATLITGFIVQQDFKEGTTILSIFIIGLGFFGAVMTRKLYQLHQSDQERLDHWYIYLEQHISQSEVLKVRNCADSTHKQKFPLLSRVPHNYFWFTLHLIISILWNYRFDINSKVAQCIPCGEAREGPEKKVKLSKGS